jgi:hypothetical protein
VKIDDNPIIRQLLKETNNRKNQKEIDVTKSTAISLKETRLGIFQNEIDYRFLLKKFRPLRTNNRSAVDILGFMGNSFNLVEFKLFDETKPKSYHHWSALYHLKQDIKKLEHAAKFHSDFKVEFYFVFAVRNSKKQLNEKQFELAKKYINEKNWKPKVRSFNQYTVLKTIELLNEKLWPNWDFEFVNRKNDSFLVGKLLK